MKHFCKIFIFLVLILNSSNSNSQNLVPNPNFELYDTCPNSLGQVNYAVGCTAFMETPDYYNGCAGALCSTPYNYAGYQQASSGSAYCAFQAYSYLTDVHEILGCSLISTLNIGQKYFITFKVVNAGIVGGPGFNCFTNKIGARFSTVAYTFSNPAPINNVAHIYTDSIIKDTVNWFTISGSFIADSSYQYIGIGNFFQDVNTDTIKLNTWAARAYYFVDDICVSTDSIYAATWTSVKEFKDDISCITIYPNPTSDITHISYQGNNAPLIFIYNSIGEKVASKIIFFQNKVELDLRELKEGIYYVNIIFNQKGYSKKIIKL